MELLKALLCAIISGVTIIVIAYEGFGMDLGEYNGIFGIVLALFLVPFWILVVTRKSY